MEMTEEEKAFIVAAIDIRAKNDKKKADELEHKQRK